MTSSPPADRSAALRELGEWLSFKHLDVYLPKLADAGYDDLSSISRCTLFELDELASLFPTSQTSRAIRELVGALAAVGIDVYRRQTDEFRRMLEMDTRRENLQARRRQVARVRKESYGEAGKWSAAAISLSAAAAARPGSGTYPTPKRLPPPVDKCGPAAPEIIAAALARKSVTAAPAETTAAAADTSAQDAAQRASVSTAPSSPTAADVHNPTLEYDISTREGAIRFHAYVNAIDCYARLLDEPLPPLPELQVQLLAGRSSVEVDRIAVLFADLRAGGTFRKHPGGHTGSVQRRLLWATPALDFLCWGADNKAMVRGFIPAAELQKVVWVDPDMKDAAKSASMTNATGGGGGGGSAAHSGAVPQLHGHPLPVPPLFVVSLERTVELEARDVPYAREWAERFDVLVLLNMAELLLKEALRAAADFDEKFAQARLQHTRLLSTGAVFRKERDSLPGSNTRLLWTPHVPDRLQWGTADPHTASRQVTGFVLMQDIVHVKPDPAHPCKLTIYALKRTVALEARDGDTRERWVRAIRFFVEFPERTM